VFDRDGRPANFAWVKLRSESGLLLGGPRSELAHRGGVVNYHGLRPGPYEVCASLEGAVLGWLPFTLTGGGTTEMTLDLPGTGELLVRVTDQEGKPIAGAIIQVRTKSGHGISVREGPVPRGEGGRPTSAEGECRWGVATEGELSVKIFKVGYQEAVVPVTVRQGETAELEVTLKR
jgi:hypothetical protein